MSRKDLFMVFAGAYPAQPATAYWRAIEIGALASCDIPMGRGLDLGCGDGILTGILLDEIGKRDLVGIDLDPLETKAASRFPFYKRIHTCSADAIPEAAASFDFVISNSVLEHIPPLEGTVAEVGRLLKSQGRFYFTVPGPGFHDNLAGSLMPGASRAHYLKSLDARLAHFHYLSPEEWREILGRHGLVLDQCRGYLNRRRHAAGRHYRASPAACFIRCSADRRDRSRSSAKSVRESCRMGDRCRYPLPQSWQELSGSACPLPLAVGPRSIWLRVC